MSEDENSSKITVKASENCTFPSVPEDSTNRDGEVKSKEEEGEAIANILTLKTSDKLGDFASVSGENINLDVGVSAEVEKVSSMILHISFLLGYAVATLVHSETRANTEENIKLDMQASAEVEKVNSETRANSEENINLDVQASAEVEKVNSETSTKALTMNTFGNSGFSSIPKDNNNLVMKAHSLDKNAESKNTATQLTVTTLKNFEELFIAFAQTNEASQKARNNENPKTCVIRFEEIGGFSESFAKGDDVSTNKQSNSGNPVSGAVFTGLEENFDDEVGARERSTLENEHGRMINSEDASPSVCPDLAQNENATGNETGSNNEQISHGTFQDSLQNEMTLEDKLNIKFGDDADCKNAPNSQANCNLDPTVFFCKFSNSFNNCWMNATMHSILNLSITRKYLTQNPEKVFGALSGTPLCATFLCTALDNPGKYFSPDEIYQVLIELSRTIPSLTLGQPNDITEFLEAILSWLNPCGINSVCKVKKVINCEDCAVVRPVMSELGPVIYLSDAQPNETTASLLERFVFVEWSQRQCCNTFSVEKKYLDSSADVITLYLHRYTSEEGIRLPVIPSATIHIPLESGTQQYRLSSVICCKTLNATTNHFYTYVVGGQRVFKADGAKIRIAGWGSADDMNKLGFIYIYEKYS